MLIRCNTQFIARLAALTLIFVLAGLFLITTTTNLNADDLSHKDGYRTRTAATGGKDHNTTTYRAWADYYARLRRDAKIDKVKGDYDLDAFVAGGHNPKPVSKKYTMKRKIWFIPVGAEVMKHHYDSVYKSNPGQPYSFASAGGGCGSLTNATESWYATSSP